MKLRRVLVAVAALVGGLGALSAGTAFAHAELISSNPANQSILPSTPSEIVLRFSEGVEPVGDSIRLVDASGDPVPLGPLDQSLGDDTLRTPVPATIDDGTYVVGWQAISADSHRIRGAFTFSVGAATPTAPGVIDDIFAAGDSSPSESLLLGAGRFLSFAGIGVLVGALFLAAVLVPELIADRRIGRMLLVAAGAAVVGTVAMFMGQAHLIAGSYFAWGDVIGIRSGQWWLARSGRDRAVRAVRPGSLVPDVAARTSRDRSRRFVRVRCRRRRRPRGLGRQRAARSRRHVVHLAAMAIWLGGLVLLLAGIPRDWFWWTAVAVLAVGARRRRRARCHR
jgi:copper transport protein